MGLYKKVELDVKANTESVKDLEKKLGQFIDASKKSFDQINEGLKDVDKNTDKAGKALGTLGKVLKGIFVIQALEAAFSLFKDTLGQNQAVVDAMSTATEFLSLAFNDFFKFIESNVGTITGYFKSIFDDPVQSLKDFGQALVDNVVERFNSLLEVFGSLAKGFLKFSKGDLAGAAMELQNAGKEMVDVFTGVDGSVDKIVETATNAAGAIQEYAKSTYEAAKSNVELQKTAEVAAVLQQGLVEKYDRQAEQLRQIRDEERNTIEERIKANNDLKATLDEQEAAMLKQVDLQIAAAQAAYDKNDSQENYIALLEAQQEKDAVLAQIEGFRSEQKMNDLALAREAADLENTIKDGQAERMMAELEFNAELIDGEYQKLLAQRDVLEQERLIEEERLTMKRDMYQKGTQAYEDANQELLTYQQENSNAQTEIERQLQKNKMQLASEAFGNLAAIFGESSAVGKAAAIAQTTIDTYQSAQSAYKSLVGIPVTGPILAPIAAAAAIAGGIANVKQITSVKTPKPKGTKSISAPAPRLTQPPSAPSFNVVGASPENQLAEAIGQREQKPVKAFVVSNEVTNAQALDRNIVDSASLG